MHNDVAALLTSQDETRLELQSGNNAVAAMPSPFLKRAFADESIKHLKQEARRSRWCSQSFKIMFSAAARPWSNKQDHEVYIYFSKTRQIHSSAYFLERGTMGRFSDETILDRTGAKPFLFLFSFSLSLFHIDAPARYLQF